METSKQQPKVLTPELPIEDIKRLTDFFEILIQIDQRERRQKNGNISEKTATAS